MLDTGGKERLHRFILGILQFASPFKNHQQITTKLTHMERRTIEDTIHHRCVPLRRPPISFVVFMAWPELRNNPLSHDTAINNIGLLPMPAKYVPGSDCAL